MRVATTFLLILLSGHGALAQCPDGTPPPCNRPARAAPPVQNSVAVLAFESRSHDSADTYLTEGFQDEISSRLGHIERLTVISPGVIRRLPGAAALPLEQVGTALHARHLVLGSFQRARDRLRVTVQLVRAQNGVQLWSESYDTRGDALEIQSDVAVRVATAILATLLPTERTVLAVRPTRNPVAWDHFQRANHYLALRTNLMIDSAVGEYEAALLADSSFLPAQARIGYACGLLRLGRSQLRGLRGDSLVSLGLAAADDALRRDSTLSDGWMARGYLLSFKNETTYDGVRESFERAVQLDPRNAEAWHQYGSVLDDLGYVEAALRALRHALDLEPARAISYRDRALAFYRNGDIARAKEASDSGLAIDSTPQNTHYRIQASAGDTIMLRRMLANAERLQQLAAARHIRALLALQAGDTATARAALGQTTTSWVLARVGLTDSAIGVLGRVNPTIRLWRDLFAPDYRSLATDPRFQAIRAAARPAAANPAIREH